MCMTLERIELIVEEPVWQEAKYIVGHVTTLGLGLEVPYIMLMLAKETQEKHQKVTETCI